MLQQTLLILKTSRPFLWPGMPFVFCMGLLYGRTDSPLNKFQFLHKFTPLMIFQIILLALPICLFIFGFNDIQDHIADRLNPRKRGLEGSLPIQQHDLIKITALAAAVLFFLSSIATTNIFNIYCAASLLVLSYTYSAPPWRLKTRPPLDVICGGLIGFFAPFGLGYSFTGEIGHFPLQAYYFTFCVMGFHAFSTIMDFEADRLIGDRTFAVAYGKRIAALFPAAIFSFGFIVVHLNYVKIFFLFCLILFITTAIYPSERLARYFFSAIYVVSIGVLGFWAGIHFF